ncbi:molybdopterin synthase subunit MoaD [Polynucleobacter meluiroseus]|uniref:Molybdopterin synthase subunit MoaD n=1 Tax=Polynucleobacter meluiroseus TaxID=1938814 RepID=A0A240DYG0_9BURK|nr:molybdopterin converting factor subunit 1 [Polynucleobacter meluiroseus]SNX28238.1 molybdopterin synthase subunit MoaD [Polynucleobacter meluiroseus]
MIIQLRFFASLRESLGISQETIVIPDTVKTIADLRSHLAERGAVWAEVMAEGKVIRCALNQQMVSDAALLQENAEVAFFPPVTGG